MGRQFQQKVIDKTYFARVEGVIEKDSGIIDLPLRCDWENRPRQIVDFEQGKSSQTEWEVIKREKQTTLVKLTPLPAEHTNYVFTCNNLATQLLVMNFMQQNLVKNIHLND